MTIPNGEAMLGNSAEKPQRQKFEDLARELEADEDPAHFEETVRKIAPTKPKAEAEKKPS